MIITKVCAGEYFIVHGKRHVRIVKVHYPNDGTYWIAAAGWDRDIVTDPLRTKRDAVFNAEGMLLDQHARDIDPERRPHNENL